MTASQEMTTESNSIDCGETLEIRNIAELSEKLRTALDSSDPIIFFDASKVDRVDAASMQLLATFFKDAQSQGMTLQWHKPSDALVETSRVLGLSRLLGLDTAKQH